MQENFTMIKMTEILLTPMTKMRHVQCKMLSLRKTKSLNTPCSPCVHFEKKSDSKILTDVLSEYYLDWTSWLQSFIFTIYFYQQTWKIYEMHQHFLSTKYNAFFTYNHVYILVKIIKSSCFFKLTAMCYC